MKSIKNLICFIISGFILLHGSAYADMSVPSSWAKNNITVANFHGMITDDISSLNYSSPISRAHLCALMLQSYNIKTNARYEPVNQTPFKDADLREVTAMNELGVISGTAPDLFEPDRNVTRQEMSKMIYNLSQLIYGGVLPEEAENLRGYADAGEIAPWARPYVSALTLKGVIKGDEKGNFMPNGDVTVEQSIAMLVRLLELESARVDADEVLLLLSAPEVIQEGPMGIKYSIDESNVVIVSWDKVSPNNIYKVELVEKRNSRYEEDIPANDPVVTIVENDTYYSFKAYPNLVYTVTVTAGQIASETVRFKTHMSVSDNQRKCWLYPFGEPETQEEADALMETVKIQGWVMEGDKKVSKTFYLKVHSFIADIVVKIYEEIYESGEQFPIKDVGGYNWRVPMSSGRLSEHNLGTAIDMNYDENYCVYSSGATVGKFWLPYENPHSITPYGIVVKTFEKYGFTWGGDQWSNPKDYMHFSYFGT